MIKTILFDLDGTLLPLNIDHFLKVYFDEMALMFKDEMDKKSLVDKVMKATGAMVKDVSDRTNKEVFMTAFNELTDGDMDLYQDLWDRFYETTYEQAKVASYISEEAIEAIKILKSKGYQLVLATNPLFPKSAIVSRIYWAGLDPDHFDYITSFEKNHYCKPQAKFYQEIMKDLNVNPNECLMVGNDTREDMVASSIGMTTYLVEDCLLDRGDSDHAIHHRGDYKQFLEYVKNIL